jgi:polysaccharide biosynthesis/export protein ExoF
MHRGLLLAALFLLASIFSNPASALDASGYKLGPLDKIEIKVFDLRAGSGEAHQWTAFNGEVVVDANGQILLPLVGQISVAGMTVNQVGSIVSSKMQDRVGLAELPSTAVQVLKYRPFYVSGSVDKPGEYEYRPNMTILQAVSIAGGLYRMSDVSQLAVRKDLQSQQGELQVLAGERQALQTRESRLEAEIAGQNAITFRERKASGGADKDNGRSESVETQLLTSRNASTEAQLKNIEDARRSLAAEIDTLKEKSVSTDRQIQMLQKDLLQARDLVSKGLATSTRQLSAEQTVSTFENNKLDIQLAVLRAQQEAAKLGREAVELRSKRQQDALLELAQVRTKLLENAERTKTVASLLMTTMETQSLFSPQIEKTTYTLSRMTPAGYRTVAASEGDQIAPGDVLQVQRQSTRPAAETIRSSAEVVGER